MDPVFGPGSEKWGIKHKKQSKIAFFQNFFLKKTMKPNFFSNFFFDENIAQEPAQLLAETWCPYLLWDLRNLPHKFEKLAHVTKSAKKNIGATACRAWARAETFNGLQKVLQILCVPGLTTL